MSDRMTCGRCRNCEAKSREKTLFYWKSGRNRQLYRAYCPDCGGKLQQTCEANLTGRIKKSLRDPKFLALLLLLLAASSSQAAMVRAEYDYTWQRGGETYFSSSWFNYDVDEIGKVDEMYGAIRFDRGYSVGDPGVVLYYHPPGTYLGGKLTTGFGGDTWQGSVTLDPDGTLPIRLLDDTDSFWNTAQETRIVPGSPRYYYYGDANRDGTVDFADFVILANHFGSHNSLHRGWESGNFDNSRSGPDFNDFVILSAHWGKTIPPVVSVSRAMAVPEPSGLILAGLGILFCIRRWRHGT